MHPCSSPAAGIRARRRLRRLLPLVFATGLPLCLALSATEPVHRLRGEPGRQRLVLRDQIEVEKLSAQVEGIVLHALPPTNWWPGCVPVFGVERDGRFELRRRPPRGQENFTDPLFFALPLEDEPDAARIAGRWECTALRADTENWFAWELTAEGDLLAGRFDPSTDYRVAFITGGTFRSNRFTLTVENNSERYELTGQWREGGLAGTWRHAGQEEHGIWQAKRPRDWGAAPRTDSTVPLHEFRRPGDPARRYSIERTLPEPGWERMPRPLCRVWRTAEPPPGRPRSD